MTGDRAAALAKAYGMGQEALARFLLRRARRSYCTVCGALADPTIRVGLAVEQERLCSPCAHHLLEHSETFSEDVQWEQTKADIEAMLRQDEFGMLFADEPEPPFGLPISTPAWNRWLSERKAKCSSSAAAV